MTPARREGIRMMIETAKRHQNYGETVSPWSSWKIRQPSPPRSALINEYARAVKSHAKRSHLQEQLTWATVEQLRYEMATEIDDGLWPTPIVVAALFIGIGCLVLAMIGV